MKKIFINLIFVSLLFILFAPSANAGCCECLPSIYKSDGKEIKSCISGSNFTDKGLCGFACASQFGPEYQQENPPEGYPKFSNLCNSTDNCPILITSCCVRYESKDKKVTECKDGLNSELCKPTVIPTTEVQFYLGESCEDINCASMIGKALFGPQISEIPPADPIEFKPQVTIPGTIKVGGKNFDIKKGEGIIVDGELLAKYIALIFKWFVSVIGFVAVAYMAFGGIQWMTAMGSAEGIKKAKETIRDSILGLGLAAISYMLLFLINPNLVGLKELDVENIARRTIKVVEGSVGVSGAKCGSGDECTKLANKPGTCKVTPVPAQSFTHASHNALYLQNDKVKNNFLAWMAEFEKETGVTMQVTSMFRTPEYQECLYKALEKGCANKACSSPHELGLAVDLNVNSLSTTQYEKLKSIANKYKFKVMNPNRGKNEKEYWHFDYLGGDVKKKVAEICPNSQCK